MRRAGPAALSAAAAVLLGLALQISSGMYDGRALLLMVAAALLALVAALWLRRAADPAPAPQQGALVVQGIFGAGCAAGLFLHLTTNPTFYGDPRALAGGFRWFAALALLLLSAYLCVHLRGSLQRARFLLLLGVFALMGVAVLRASPRPWIDVWVFQQIAARALRHGVDPYSLTFPNIYGSLTSQMYAPELVVRGRVAAFPYPPLTAIAGVPAFALFGDVRYAMLACMVAAAWAVGRAGQGPAGELAALFILFQPRTFFVLEQGFSEAMVAAFFALALLALLRGRALLAGLALGLLAASKQYSPFLVLPLAVALPQRGRLRALLLAAAVAALCLVPFALWDWDGFLRGVVRFQLLQNFRADSLSIPAWLSRHSGGATVSGALSPLLGALVLLATLRRQVGAAVASAAAALLVIVLFYKFAFCNYAWLCSALSCAAAAARCAGEKR